MDNMVKTKYDVAFDQYQRYETIARLIQLRKKPDLDRGWKVLELGANEHKNLKLFLPDADILFTDVVLSDSMKEDPEFRQEDGTRLSFEDRSFDFVVAADVLEHVAPKDRARFLEEAYRVARNGVIVSCPRDDRDVSDAEKRANDYYKALAGEDFIWLKEHSLNGLPKAEDLAASLRSRDIAYFCVEHGAVATWEKLWYCHFDTVFSPETLEYRKGIDRYYNAKLYEGDVSNHNYRVFYVLAHGECEEWSQAAKTMWEQAETEQAHFLDTLLLKHQSMHMLHEKGALQKAVIDKECHIQNQNAMLESLRAQVEAKTEELAAASDKEARLACRLQETEKQLASYQVHYQAAMNQLTNMTAMYNEISNATCWKITKPIRVTLDTTKRLLKSNRYTHLFCKGLKCLKQKGFAYTWKKVKDKLRHRQDFTALNTRQLYTPEELERQRAETFEKDVKFSVLVPLYNTPEHFLHEMIQSVIDQTYANWELCLADGSDSEHPDVEKICRKYAEKDARVRYLKLEKNLGISGNTNACIDMAEGDYLALFDHDDLLHPAALYEMMKAICEQGADFIYTDENTFHNTPKDAYCPHFKPDYAPDTLRANNYICHFTAFKRSLIDVVGKFRPECDGSQDFDMVLRLTEKAEKIVHIPKILYYWRAHANSVADSVGAKPYVIEAAHRAVQDHLDRVGLKGEVLDTVVPSMYRIRYELTGQPKVSILIPNYEHVAELKTCLESIYSKTTYPNFEIIVIENNSKSPETFAYYKEIEARWENLKVITWDSYFNYSAINNFGAKYAEGEYLLLLNNDTEIITPDWIQEMLMFAQREDVGAVGAKLYYPDDTVQHAGLGIGLLTLAGHLHRNFDRNHPGYMGRLIYAQDLSAVTAACVMVRRDVWDELGGLDETFEVAFNDVDLCMRIRKAGYLIVWTPFAELYHYESKSRGSDEAPEKRKRFLGEVARFQTRWAKELAAGDPYYNPNFTLDKEDFSIR